jgi:hypothetical protein
MASALVVLPGVCHENIRTASISAHVTPRQERERLAEYLK